MTHEPSNHIAIPACTASVTQNLSHLCCVPQINTERQGSRYRTNLIPRLGDAAEHLYCVGGKPIRSQMRYESRERVGVLTREDVGDGEDAERPPDGAQLGLLDQIVDALHPLPHLGLQARARRGAARPVGGGGGLRWDRVGCGIPHPKGLRHRRRRRPGRALPAATRLHGDFYF